MITAWQSKNGSSRLTSHKAVDGAAMPGITCVDAQKHMYLFSIAAQCPQHSAAQRHCDVDHTQCVFACSKYYDKS